MAEPELGLGVVRDVGPKSVTLDFPATGDTRQYARANAPLRRAAFRVGDTIAAAGRTGLPVTAVQEDGGILFYLCDSIRVCETDLAATLGFSQPLTRLFAAAFDPAHAFELRASALAQQHRIRQSPVRGFLGPRIDLLPHQLGIAQEVAGRSRPRVLLADEVGLGKTIEAGLILHRLLLSGRLSRVLILVPPSLVHQWFVELLRRFNLWFSIFDEERCAAIQAARADANPFLDSQLVLADLDLLTRHDGRLAQAIDAGWDALVVDEAHHLGWTPDRATPAYAAVEALGRRTPSLLLLTATPEQLGIAGHFARLRLLDPDRFHSLDAFVAEAKGYGSVAEIVDRLSAAAPLTSAQHEQLAGWLGVTPQTVAATLAAEGIVAAAAWIDALLDRHGPGRVMFRNTRAAVTGFPQRVPHLVRLEPPPESPDGTRGLHREWLADRDGVPDERQPNLRADARAAWLASLVQSLEAGTKVLVICRTPQRVLALDAALRHRSASLTLALFHEGLTLVQRDRSAASFADPHGVRLLLASEIGSEGRNFQFAHHLVLFDLPLDPALLEQRIGRLDRIGQTEPIHVHVPYVAHSHQEVLAHWYHDGLGAFAAHVPGGRELMDRFGERVRDLADRSHDRRYGLDAAIDRLITDTRLAARDVAERVERGRDRLLERNSFRPRQAARIIDDVLHEGRQRDVDDLLLGILDLLVVEVEEIAPRTYRLGSAGTLVDDFPGLPADGLTLTADRRRALAREDLQFLTWDHPIVTGALDLMLGSERGNCGYFRWVDPTPGLYLDTIHVLECLAPAYLHVDRFLPPTPVRVVVNHRGELCPAAFLAGVPSARTVEAPTMRAESGRAWLARADVREQILPRMIEACQRAAESQRAPLVSRARADAEVQLDLEIRRLRDLQRINPSVRDDEIQALVDERQSVVQHLDGSRLRLDAVRLIHRGPIR